MRTTKAAALAMTALVAACSPDSSSSPLAPNMTFEASASVASCGEPPARSLAKQLLRFAPSVLPLNSVASATPTSVRFTNATCGDIQIFWVNYSGARVLYAILAPGASYDQQTYLTHPWIVSNGQGDLVGFLPAKLHGEAYVYRRCVYSADESTCGLSFKL